MSEVFIITQQDIDRYAQTSGDHNPIHLDEEQAKNHEFLGTIAHGMLTMAKVWSIISNHLLPSTDFPSSYELEFPSPVYANHVIVLQVDQKGSRLQIIGKCKERVVVKGFILFESIS